MNPKTSRTIDKPFFMKSFFAAFFPIFFLCLLPAHPYAAMQGTLGHHYPHAVCADAGLAKSNGLQRLFRHNNFFKISTAWQDAKAKIKRKTVVEKEKASFKAKLALYLFIGAIVLQLLLRAASIYTPVISTIIGLAYLASIALALIVVFSDENRKSKAIAKTLLIIYGISIIISILLFIFLILLFAALI
jgi:hypothetical protein